MSDEYKFYMQFLRPTKRSKLISFQKQIFEVFRATLIFYLYICNYNKKCEKFSFIFPSQNAFNKEIFRKFSIYILWLLCHEGVLTYIVATRKIYRTYVIVWVKLKLSQKSCNEYQESNTSTFWFTKTAARDVVIVAIFQRACLFWKPKPK